MSSDWIHLSYRDALSRVPTPEGKRFVELVARGTLKVELYAPRGADPQQPHDQDELYIVAAGRGEFVCGDTRVAFEPLDALFAPAGVAHRFEHFTDDLAVWVVFYGPAGGEAGADTRG